MSVLNVIRRSASCAFRTVTIHHRKSMTNLRLTAIRFYSSSKFSSSPLLHYAIACKSSDDDKSKLLMCLVTLDDAAEAKYFKAGNR